MARYLVVNTISKVVANVIELEDGVPYPLPIEYTLVQSDVGNIGWGYKAGKLINTDKPSSFPAPTENQVRASRDGLLASYDRKVSEVIRSIRQAGASADVTDLYDYLSELDAYAQELQNVPKQSGFPVDVVWPTFPVMES